MPAVIRLAFISAGCALACLGAAAPAPAADLAPTTTYGAFAPVSGVTAAGGWTAWSVKGAGGWRLAVRAPGGALSAPAIPARAIPFDARFGVRSGGGVVLAYSRCVRDPRSAAGGVVLAWPTARGCSIHLFDPVTGRDTRLSRTPGATADVLPAVSGNRIAHASIRTGAATAGVFTRTLDNGRPRRVFTGPARRLTDGSSDISQGPVAVAVGPRHVALHWVYRIKEDVGLSTFETRLVSVGPRGRVTLSTTGGSTSGSCTGYTDYRALVIAGGQAISQVVSPVGWELEGVALDQPLKVRQGRARARRGYGTGATGEADVFLPSVGIDGQRLALTTPSDVGEVGLEVRGSRSRLDDPYGCA